MLKTVITNIKWGILWGLRIAFGFTVIAVAALPFADLSELFIPLPLLFLLYPVLGILGGLVVGLMRPLLRYKLGAMAIGSLAFLAVYGPILLIVRGNDEWRRGDAIALLVILIVGAIGGPLFQAVVQRKTPH